MKFLVMVTAFTVVVGCKVTVGEDQDPTLPNERQETNSTEQSAESSAGDANQSQSIDNEAIIPVSDEDIPRVAQQVVADKEIVSSIRDEASQGGAQDLEAPIQETEDNLLALETATDADADPMDIAQRRFTYCSSLISLKLDIEARKRSQSIDQVLANSLTNQIADNKVCQVF